MNHSQTPKGRHTLNCMTTRLDSVDHSYSTRQRIECANYLMGFALRGGTIFYA